MTPDPNAPGSRSPVLLIQGVGVHGAGWQPQLAALSPDYPCLAPDNRGIGHGPPLDGRLTVQQMAADARAHLSTQAWPAAHLIGHSLGGLVALQLSLETPHLVRSLSLLCTFADGSRAGASARMFWIGLRTRIGTRAMRRAAFLEILAPPGAIAPSDREHMAAEMAPLFGHDLADHPAVEIHQLSAMRRCNLTPQLGRLAGIPTLVVTGAHDPIAPPTLGRAIADGIPGSRYVELADASHGAPILQAEEVNRLLREHLERCEALPIRSPAAPPLGGGLPDPGSVS